MRRLGIALALVVLGVPTLLYSSARWSLDDERSHTAATNALPLLTEGSPDGLVRIPVGSHVFRARVAGLSQTGPNLLLLHGFPETSAMWEPLMPAAAAAGFRVAAFDQRGYSPGARPEEVGAYATPALAADVLGVADALGFETFHLVGHDWGSIVGWVVTAKNPERVLSWASLSIPHPKAILAERGDEGPPAYVVVFRTPGLAETLLTFGDLLVMRRVLYADMPASVRDEYVAVFSEHGALTAALDWYRAPPADSPDPWGLGSGEIAQPTLFVFGSRDMPVFTAESVRRHQPRFVTGPLTTVELDAGHWLMQEEPARVVEAVMEHLEREATKAPSQ